MQLQADFPYSIQSSGIGLLVDLLAIQDRCLQITGLEATIDTLQVPTDSWPLTKISSIPVAFVYRFAS